MNRSARRLFAFALGVTLARGPVALAIDGCPGTLLSFQHEMDKTFQTRVQDALPGITEAAIKDTPRFTIAGQQDSSPSENGTNATIVNAARFASMLSAAFDQTAGGQSGSDASAVTLNASPFLLATAYDPGVYYDQARYEQTEYMVMRRIGGTVSFGGKGEAIDQDGDGTVDEPLSSNSLTDIVTWEARFGVWGSRDRREKENFDKIKAAFQQGTQGQEAKDAFTASLAKLLLDGRIFGYWEPGVPTCMTSEKWTALQQADWFKSELNAVIENLIKANSAYLEATREIDQQVQVTAVVNGVQREKQFGADQVGLAVRATWWDLTGNFSWSEQDSSGPNVNQYGLGLQYGHPILRDLVGGSGIDATLSAVLDIYNNSPNVAHSTTVKLQGALQIPLTDGVNLPLSVTWANHEDLLSNDGTVVGRFGINVNTDTLMDFLKSRVTAH